ncbi:Brefeldin a-inhibited guanine nucleotide-exchange protein 3-like [Plakobranchus ocellatus]|uniref:Brefeldin a-inhibited guanine nucleotide-exchange protein 3-like n=1 Tax=Plakobranchus ocellatus TaxID=259542 RepID=A0AAV3YL57_9GAST|nr:Brefeldin a-inhibited guanine nucleotide-exchange protein 3-like [Plakobranchus ocellatus]
MIRICHSRPVWECSEDDGDDVLADFKANSRGVSRENLISEVVLILNFLSERLETASIAPQGKQTLPLLLEGVNTILGKVPSSIRDNRDFQELLWQRLCPCLIVLLGEPKTDKSTGKGSRSGSVGPAEVNKSIGSSTSSPNINQASARVIYSIAGELASLVGGIPQLRPVLEALFHKILMFPLPPSRHDALRVVKELLSNPQRVVSLIGTGTPRAANSGVETNLALIKMLVESIQQSSHHSEPTVVYTSVACIDGFLASLDRLRQGEAIPDFMLKPSKESGEKVRRSMTSNPDDDGGSDLTCDLYDEDSFQAEQQGGKSLKNNEINKEVVNSDPSSNQVQTTSADSSSATSTATSTSKPTSGTGVTKSPGGSPTRAQFEAQERENARRFLATLQQVMPELMDCRSVWDVDEMLQELASRFCSSISQNVFGPQTGGAAVQGVVLNSDGVYFATIAALKLNLRLLESGYYKYRRSVHVTQSEFLNEMFSSGLLLYLPPAWLRELYRHVLKSSLLRVDLLTAPAESGMSAAVPLVQFLQDLEGLGTTEERGRLMSEHREESDSCEVHDADRARRVEAGKSLAASVMSACWPEVLDILSVMLNDPSSVGGGSGGSSGGGGGSVLGRPSLALLLATDSAQEDVRRARSAICTSLNGLQRAAKLCCVLGLQQLCGNVFSQLARTSCVKEDFRAAAAAAATAAAETGGKSHGKASSLLSSSGGNAKPKLVRLHAAHVLSMDVVMTTGLEMGGHSADCWKHVFRCCAHISELEHTYFSQGNNQSSLPKVTAEAQKHQAAFTDGTDADGVCDPDLYSAPVMAAVPVAPRINVPALIQQSSLESGWDNSLAAGGVLTFAQASKALCGLSQEVDSLFEDAADKLCLEALLGFFKELGEATVGQLYRLAGGYGTSAGDHGGVASSVQKSRPPTNALHLYRLQQVLIRVVNSSRPLLHLLRVWSVVSPYLVQATGNSDHVISKMAVTSIHEFIVSLVSQRQERPHFHVNEYVCKTFEDMLCLELCDGDVQDQIVCCICELVEACSSQLQSGWRPLFGALRSVKIEYTTNEEVNEARQRHVAAVMDVFNVYLDMDNITVFASATVDCVLCLLKYVHGPATFDSDLGDNQSDSGSDEDYGDAEGELESLCVPALQYLKSVCGILASMWQMPASPVFKGAHRIQIDATARLVDPIIPSIDFKLFAEEFGLHQDKPSDSGGKTQRSEESSLSSGHPLQAGQSLSVLSETVAGASKKEDAATVASSTLKEKFVEPGSDSASTEDISARGASQPHEADAGAKDSSDPSSASPSIDNKTDKNTNNSQSPAEPSQEVTLTSEEKEGLGKSNAVPKARPTHLSGLEQHHSEGDPSTHQNNPPRSSPSSRFNLHESFSDIMDSKTIVQTTCYKTLDEMDNQSGVLHVWFLLLDGLVSAVNRCPKAVQSHALNTLIDLLKSAASVPGPEFSLHSVNHLFLPMLQAWLRRGARCYGYWNTGIVSFKQCCGLLADLVVEFVERFAGKAGLELQLQLMLQQTMDVFTEHILLTSGPSLSEHLWHVSVAAVERALSVTTYNLRLLMALFHANSDNFYGDIGQVKVATRKDCKVVDCLRLRQMAQQVFLLDSQVLTMPPVQYDTEQDKSFVFLLYPPDHQDSLNPDHISTRVPFRHIVVGLLSNQLLLQTVGTVLLEPGLVKSLSGTGKEEQQQQQRDLPGLMSYMSTRVLFGFLEALEATFRVAQDFDARPGLKFLLQKVASLETAANLYKTAATAVLFQVHSLIQVCAHLENASISSTRAAITPGGETPSAFPSVSDLKVMASTSRARPCSEGRVFLPLLQLVCEELCQEYMRVLGDAGKGGTAALIDKLSQQPIFFLTAQHDDITKINAQTALQHQQQMLQRSKSVEQKGRLCDAPADAEDASSPRLRSRSLDHHSHDSRVLGEKKRSDSVRSRSSVEIDAPSVGGEVMGTVSIATPQAQDDDDFLDSLSDEGKSIGTMDETEEDSDRDIISGKSKREVREDLQSKVYTVATDQVIENLMQQYKRHKHLRAMPNFVRPVRHPKLRPKVPRREPVEEDIEKQQKSSIMKDSEAHVQAWSDSLTAILQMTMALPDDRFSTLLPVTFTLVSQLILYAGDPALRDQLAQCFNRLGRLYDFAPPPTPTGFASASSNLSGSGDAPPSSTCAGVPASQTKAET